MISTAIMFPGQGSQQVGMGLDFYNEFDRSKFIFEEADRSLGYKLSEIIFKGSEDELRLTMNTQPALLTVSIAIWDIISTKVDVGYFIGHSLGEYTAITAAGGISFTEAVKAVHNRGKFMQSAVAVGVGAMAAVLGVEDSVVIDICKEVSTEGSIIEPANFNCDGQVVVAGHAIAFERFTEVAKAKGVKRVIMLPVSAPFHCSLMQKAKSDMEDYLKKNVDIKNLLTPIVNNVDAKIVSSKEDIADGLIRQVAGAVRFTDSIRNLIDNGVNRFIEVGSGSVLSGLVKKINKDVTVINISKVADLELLK